MCKLFFFFIFLKKFPVDFNNAREDMSLQCLFSISFLLNQVKLSLQYTCVLISEENIFSVLSLHVLWVVFFFLEKCRNREAGGHNERNDTSCIPQCGYK